VSDLKQVVVLLSGGLDSATALACAQRDGFDCSALAVLYGQRHSCEVDAAMRVAAHAGVPLHIAKAPALGELAGSALTRAEFGHSHHPDAQRAAVGKSIEVPKDRNTSELSTGIPPTYVPARNTVLLGLALAMAETIGARVIYTGFNVLDASGYPDCRPLFLKKFAALADVATAPGAHWQIRAPLIELTKAQIIRLGVELGVDYSITHTCYDPREARRPLNQIARGQSRTHWLACGRCDACVLRRRGFAEAGVPDPTRYA
jgi:7-cyano-7-deazaguanine synthase